MEFQQPESQSQRKMMRWDQLQELKQGDSSIEYGATLKDLSLYTVCKFNQTGDLLAIGDEEGFVTLFEVSEKGLTPYFEFHSHSNEFNILYSQSNSPCIKDLEFVNSSDRNLLLTASYGKIKLEAIQHEKNVQVTTQFDESGGLCIPHINKIISPNPNKKTRKLFKLPHSKEINSLSSNVWSPQFISAESDKILLWDLNYTNESFNVFQEPLDSSEKINKAKYSQKNDSILGLCTNKGSIKICDLRISSNPHKNSTDFFEKNETLNNTVFGSAITNCFDLAFSPSNEYEFASRHFLNVNLWDMRISTSQPLEKYYLYEPILNSLSEAYKLDYIRDKFTLSFNIRGNFLVTGGYGMFNVIDRNERLNYQIPYGAEKTRNVARKFNLKGSCSYKDLQQPVTIDFADKSLNISCSPKENFIVILRRSYLNSFGSRSIERKL